MIRTEAESKSLDEGPSPVSAGDIDPQSQLPPAANQHFIFPAQASHEAAGKSVSSAWLGSVWLAVQFMMQHKVAVLGVAALLGLASAFRAGLEAGLETIQFVSQLGILAAVLWLVSAAVFYVFITLPRAVISKWKGIDRSEASRPASLVADPEKHESSEESHPQPAVDVPRETLPEARPGFPAVEPESPYSSLGMPPAAAPPLELEQTPVFLTPAGEPSILNELDLPFTVNRNWNRNGLDPDLRWQATHPVKQHR